MIRARFTRVDRTIRKVTIRGHAKQNEAGKDIVCAAISTAIIVTMNALERLGRNDRYTCTLEEGYFQVTVNRSDEIVEGLLANLEHTVRDIENDYPKYVNYQKEE
ncbi:MAG: ribosomal-processing cysteine protease Prp [Acholeplasmataceae bacterium]